MANKERMMTQQDIMFDVKSSGASPELRPRGHIKPLLPMASKAIPAVKQIAGVSNR